MLEIINFFLNINKIDNKEKKRARASGLNLKEKIKNNGEKKIEANA
jgi:hypothetical protein